MPQDKSNRMTEETQLGPGLCSVPASDLWFPGSKRQWYSAGLAVLVLILGFFAPFWNLVSYATSGESGQLSSYILLIPFITGYLLWAKRRDLVSVSTPPRKMAAVFFAAGLMVLAGYWIVFRPRLRSEENVYLVIMMISFLFLLAGSLSLFLGAGTLRAAVFPLCFLFFLVPIPAFLLAGIDSFLQTGSAAVAWLLFKLAGTPFISDGLVFQLPGITIRIAPECSGIHSTLVLFITSLLASYVFLRNPWKRAVFVLLVIPLGILRNGFRVFTIGEMCEHIGPQMINSPIHHKGGPIFFVLALIPLFVVLIFLQRSERAFSGAKSANIISGHE